MIIYQNILNGGVALPYRSYTEKNDSNIVNKKRIHILLDVIHSILLNKYLVTGDQPVKLTTKESELLELLCRHETKYLRETSH